MSQSITNKPFRETFFDDRIISPEDRRILLLEVKILARLGEDGETFRPLLDSMTLPDLVTLLADHDCSLKIVPTRRK